MNTVSSPPSDRVAYGILVGLSTVQLAFNLYWAGVEGLGRVGLWPHSWVWFDLDAFLANEVGVSQLIFATFVVLFLIAYILVWMRRRSAVWVMLMAIVVGRLDWILLALNNYLTGSWMMLAETSSQLIILLLCWALKERGFFV